MKIEDHDVTFEWPLMRSKEIIFESDIWERSYLYIYSLDRSYYLYYINKHTYSEDTQMKLSYHVFLYILAIA